MKQFKSYSGMAAVCAMLTLASCGNDIELTEAQAPVKGEYKVTFTASQESSATRTAVDGSNVVWQTGDAITVFDGAGENCSFEIVKGVGTTLGEFDGTITVTEPKKYSAVYPLEPDAGILSADDLVEDNIISADDVDESAVYIGGLTLSGEQVATPNGFDPLAAIMTARNDNADKITSTKEDLSLGEFKHVCAFVKVTTTEEYDKITFTANGGDSIAGGFVAQVGADGVSKVIPTDPACTVSLVPATGSTKIAAGTYFIAILPGTLEEGFTMSCCSIDETNCEVTAMVRSFKSSTGAFSRHSVVNMGTVNTTDWTKVTQKYVDMGLSVKWAVCNVCATEASEYGDYFAWGETSPKLRESYQWHSYKWRQSQSPHALTKYNVSDGKTILDASDDAAHINWGGVWRTPTDEEIQELLSNRCTWHWTSQNNVDGYLVKNPRTGNSIFLPASGVSGGDFVGLNGYYLTSTLNSSYPGSVRAYGVYFDSKNLKRSDEERCYGHSVRPVLP